MKGKIFVVFALILAIIGSFALVGCNPALPADEDLIVTETTDNAYTLVLSGLVDLEDKVLPDISITKAMIKTLYQTKPVNYTAENYCYASDKTDVDGNPIPHTLKGVYLEDILAEFTISSNISKYGSMTLNATDSYVTVATEDIFNSSGRGSKMIIAFEYDGVQLSTAERSGALRAVFPDQLANSWAKKLNKIEFSTDILLKPAVNKIYFYELLSSDFDGNCMIQKETTLLKYYGISIEKLIEGHILDAQSTDKMHLSAWDYNSESESYSEYQAWTKHDVYSVGYLLDQFQDGEEAIENLSRAPIFDGPTFSAGMTVKNVLSMSVFNASIVSLETAIRRYDTNNDGIIYTKDILLLLNMYDADDSYVITTIDDTEIELTATQIFTSTITKDAEAYTLNYGSKSTSFKKIAIKI